MSTVVAQVENAGPVSIGRISMVFRVGDLAGQMRDMGSRLRAELRRTLDFLGRTAMTDMVGRAPQGPTGRLRASIVMRSFEKDDSIRVAVRPKLRYASTVEGGFSGTVGQYARRPPANRLRRQVTAGLRAKAAYRGTTLVRVRDYQRRQSAQPFIQPVHDAMVEVARKSLENAAKRATRSG